MKPVKRKRIAALFCAVLALPALCLLYVLLPVYHRANPAVEAMRRRFLDEGLVIHAGGFLTTRDGETVAYTNSYDALVNLYSRGHRICEIDLRKTPDGMLICAHGDETHLADGLELPPDASGPEFLNAKIYGEFETMSVDRLAGFMREHEDLLVITDTRDDNGTVCSLLSERYPDLQDRFIIQIYHEYEYEEARELGFSYVIYTLYLATDEELNFWRLRDFAEAHELVGMTFHDYHYSSPIRRIAMQRAGVPLMYHTVNDPNRIRSLLRGRNVYAVYTDLVQGAVSVPSAY